MSELWEAYGQDTASARATQPHAVGSPGHRRGPHRLRGLPAVRGSEPLVTHSCCSSLPAEAPGPRSRKKPSLCALGDPLAPRRGCQRSPSWQVTRGAPEQGAECRQPGQRSSPAWASSGVRANTIQIWRSANSGGSWPSRAPRPEPHSLVSRETGGRPPTLVPAPREPADGDVPWTQIGHDQNRPARWTGEC